MSRRPLCIDSKVVERVDRISTGKVESIYRCAYDKYVPFSSYFYEKIRDLNYRTQQTERILESIEPFLKKVKITIDSDRPYAFFVQRQNIYIGEKLFEAPGHLEKALAKIWFRERNASLFNQQALMEEVITDFLVFLQKGDLDLGDPDSLLKTAFLKFRWPYVIKTPQAYCESPWKRSEHYQICQEKISTESPLNSQIVSMSLRPLLASNWVKSYRALPVAERYSFVQGLPRFLRSEHTPMLPLTMSLNRDGDSSTALMQAAEALKAVNSYIGNSNQTKDSRNHRQFFSNFTNSLRANGFQNAFAEASFEILFVSDTRVDKSSPAFENILKLAEKNPGIQMALQDSENIWMLPSRYSIPLKSFGQIRSARTVVEKCGEYNFNYVMNYADVTEKVLIVNTCDSQQPVSYEKFLKEGPVGFGAENNGVSFIQFHLPSLLMKKQELEVVLNVFDFIKSRDLENPSFKSLGWKEVQWNKTANAYQPKAYIDAIEWFRLPN